MNKEFLEIVGSGKPTGNEGKSAAAVVRRVRQLSCVSQDTEPPESAAISSKGTRVLEPIRRVRFTRAAFRQAHPRKRRSVARENSSQNSSSAKSLHSEI